MEVHSIWHICLVVENLERSVEFYRDVLKMNVIKDVYEREGPAFTGLTYGCEKYGLADANDIRIRCALIGAGQEHEDATYAGGAPAVLDLVEYINPPSAGEAYDSLCRIGLSRVALVVDSVSAWYEHLVAQGIEVLSEPMPTGALPEAGLAGKAYLCFLDPDGIVVELYGSL